MNFFTYERVGSFQAEGLYSIMVNSKTNPEIKLHKFNIKIIQ